MAEVADILLVCTGNICRSPFAEALLIAEARRRADPDPPLRVHSAGVRGLRGHGVVAEMEAEAADRGLTLSPHRGERLSAEAADRADLVLTMTEAQRDRLASLAPEAEPRTFTLKEFARLVEHVAAPDGGAIADRIEAVVRRAHAARPRVATPVEPEDVADPYGGPRAGYREAAAEIESVVTRIAAALFGPRPGPDRASDGG